jgi:hypothetical protein
MRESLTAAYPSPHCVCAFMLEDKTASDFLYSRGRLGKDVIAATDIEVGPCDQLIGGPVPE